MLKNHQFFGLECLKNKHFRLRIEKNVIKACKNDDFFDIFNLKITKNNHFRGRAKRGRDGMGFLRSKIVISIEKLARRCRILEKIYDMNTPKNLKYDMVKL
jgi:hypothetical protein